MHRALQPTPHHALSGFRFRIIVAGSRGFDDYALFSIGMLSYLRKLGARRSEVVFISGKAKSGADAMIIRWCQEHGLPWAEFPADWDDLEAEGAVLRRRADGVLFNVLAGFFRNERMAQAGTNLIVWWDGVSTGTQDMLARAEKHNLVIETILIDTPPKKVNHAREPKGRGGRHHDLDRAAAAR